jgi:EAL domain-containing protein (putative c-di-GMP-specific phosphodiesterase class I)
MPLTDLIRYFNSTDSAGDSTLYCEGEGAAAWHDGLRLRSLFQPIVDLERRQVVGHKAFLAATHEDGTPLSAEAAYAACQSAESVVHFDRLCRTLHALNFLAQRRQTGGYLQLSVHPRHLLAVPSKHGLVFEAVLKRCGLAPDDLVLELATGRILGDQRQAEAVHNYRQRGYRIALAGDGEHPELFAPDIIKRAVHSLSELDNAGAARIHVDGVRDAADLAQACRHGAHLAQGPLFGEAQANCVSTHSAGGVAYNSPTEH